MEHLCKKAKKTYLKILKWFDLEPGRENFDIEKRGPSPSSGIFTRIKWELATKELLLKFSYREESGDWILCKEDVSFFLKIGCQKFDLLRDKDLFLKLYLFLKNQRRVVLVVETSKNFKRFVFDPPPEIKKDEYFLKALHDGDKVIVELSRIENFLKEKEVSPPIRAYLITKSF